jgi:hypothetical protein
VPIDGVKIDDVDRRVIDAAIAEMHATGEIGDASVDDLEVVMLAALLDAAHRDATAAVKASIALLAAEAHLRHVRHMAPTESLRPKREPEPRPRIKWPWGSQWGALVRHDDDGD